MRDTPRQRRMNVNEKVNNTKKVNQNVKIPSSLLLLSSSLREEDVILPPSQPSRMYSFSAIVFC